MKNFDREGNLKRWDKNKRKNGENVKYLVNYNIVGTLKFQK